MNNQLIGPPTPGPRIRVIGKGLDIFIRVDDELDSEIVTLALRIAERRRYEASRPNEQLRAQNAKHIEVFRDQAIELIELRAQIQLMREIAGEGISHD